MEQRCQTCTNRRTDVTATTTMRWKKGCLIKGTVLSWTKTQTWPVNAEDKLITHVLLSMWFICYYTTIRSRVQILGRLPRSVLPWNFQSETFNFRLRSLKVRLEKQQQWSLQGHNVWVTQALARTQSGFSKLHWDNYQSVWSIWAAPFGRVYCF